MIDQAAAVVTNPDLAQQVAALTAISTQISAFLSHVTVGGASAHAIQYLKGRPTIGKWWSLLSDRGKVIAGAIMAALGSLGISFTFSHTSDGVYSFVFSGVTAAGIGQHLWSFGQSWVMQQGWYQTVIKARPVMGVEKPEPIVGGAKPEPVAPVIVAKP
jgi:hypothetical protein